MDKGKRKKSRGSTNNKRRLEAFRKRGKDGGADWGACDPAILQTVVVAITELGGAITLSLSRDKGAHGLTLLLDDDRVPLWFNRDADLSAELHGVLAMLVDGD
ncbi:MAG: hypothetical protein J3T61_12500 [Candidatus Brocadiales bacterium]|nr:hypothetical protein [Candidatus Bathyanammoxibius sp.]